MSRFQNQPHELFHLLSESIRLRILCLLQDRELCVCDLVDILELPQPTISRHLILLKQAGLVRVRRFQRYVFYSLPENKDDLYWPDIAGLLEKIRKRSAPMKADIKAMKSRIRPACPILIQP